jgi:hypothetical protein
VSHKTDACGTGHVLVDASSEEGGEPVRFFSEFGVVGIATVACPFLKQGEIGADFTDFLEFTLRTIQHIGDAGDKIFVKECAVHFNMVDPKALY